MKKAVKTVGIILIAAVIIAAIAVGAILSRTVFVRHPELKVEPETGKWYRITPDGTKSSDGSEWHGLIRVGTENKVAVYFFGGGVSINGYTSEHGKEFFPQQPRYRISPLPEESAALQKKILSVTGLSLFCHTPVETFTVEQVNIIIQTAVRRRWFIITATATILPSWMRLRLISAIQTFCW
jgi:hypothetical protein